MHEGVTFTPFAIVLIFLLQFGVPLACAALTIDAARRPASAFGRFGRWPWGVPPFVLLVTALASFIVPENAVLSAVSILGLPGIMVFAFVYLMRVVFAVPKEPSGS